jgi:hypothetical protein
MLNTKGAEEQEEGNVYGSAAAKEICAKFSRIVNFNSSPCRLCLKEKRESIEHATIIGCWLSTLIRKLRGKCSINSPYLTPHSALATITSSRGL